jgi:putative SOS response-associated peptidase YedK
MCGRYQLKQSGKLRDEMEALFGVSFAEFAPRFNAAPSQVLPVVTAGPTGGAEVHPMQWGFVPYWEKSEKPRLAPINARAETAMEKGMFKRAVQKRRCLIPADGFYEWKREGAFKQPFDIHLTGGRPFFFAGISEAATEIRPETFLLFTTQPNELMARIHDRMPAILTGQRAKDWISPGELAPEAFAGFTSPFPAAEMEARPVSSFVNNARNEGPLCIEPIDSDDIRLF